MKKYRYIKLTTKQAKNIEKKLKENDGYCPCSIVKTEDTKCMCKNFREQQEESQCHCGLYEKFEVK